MSSTRAVEPDRRRRRHQESAEEVLAVALEIMGESGAAGLSLGEVARRMGVKPPSLYVYFPSKAALCDEVFARGWRAAAALLDSYADELAADPDPQAFLMEAATAFVSWAVDHPAYAQLMFWRPVPSWEPSREAYLPARELFARTTDMLRTLRTQGAFRPDLDLDEATDAWTVLVAGLVSQQLANQPGQPAAEARYLRAVKPLVTGFVLAYGPGGTSSVTSSQTSSPTNSQTSSPTTNLTRRSTT